MNLKLILVSLLVLVLSCTPVKSIKNNNNLNYVPNEETAVKIAEAIWNPLYGKNIENFKPYKARMKDSLIWIVEGTLEKGKGGVPYIEINKKDCKILKVTHGK